jgi:4'-phosphopantetheinyl transferase
MPSKNLPQPEERPKGSRLEGRTACLAAPSDSSRRTQQSVVHFRGGVSPAEAAAALSDREAHVWRLEVPRLPDLTPSLLADLDEIERARARRFVQARDRVRFAAAHAALRAVLAPYAGRPAAALAFAAGAHGKPHLAGSGPAFNISHSGPWVLIAIARSGSLGVDVEAHRAMADRDAIARRMFAAEELAQLKGLSGPAASAGFFRVWSAKEAFIKAVGLGLFQALDGFAVDIGPSGPRLLRVPDRFAPAAAWSVTWLDMGEAAAGCCTWRPAAAVAAPRFAGYAVDRVRLALS